MSNKILEKVEKVIFDHCDEYTEYLDNLMHLFNNDSSTDNLREAILKEFKENEELIDEILAEDEENNSPLPIIKTIIDRMHNCSSELELKKLLSKIVKEEFK